MLEMTELVQKSSRSVMVILILPPAETMDAALDNSTVRMHGIKETRYLNQHVDWIPWLFKLSTGVFTRVAVALPYVEESQLTHTKLWHSMKQTNLINHIMRQ